MHLRPRELPRKPRISGDQVQPLPNGGQNRTSVSPQESTADIQAILTVLGRRDCKYERENQNLSLNQIVLSGATLVEANLSAASLMFADLSKANLRKANLSRADLMFANLSKADLRKADLSGALLPEANLSGAFFTGANLSRAYLYKADLRGADLRGAYLYGADLRGANLGGTNLGGTKLDEALNLTQDQINSAKGDAHTKLPANLDMPERWEK